MNLNSDLIKKGVERAPHRALLRASGLTNEDMKKPLIAIANSWTEIVPGHIHLKSVASSVKYGIHAAGGVPLEFNTIAICDGIAMAHPGMRNPLPSREVIADSIELEINAHNFDAMVCICSCDKIVPGMIMAACRLNIPTIFVTGGPMLPGWFNGKYVGVSNIFECISTVKQGKMSLRELQVMEECACPGAGACAGMYTANTMQCLTEAIGLSLPYSSTTPAVYSQKLIQAKESGIKIVELLKSRITPQNIVTEESLENAIMVDMALGGSTNTVLHLIAIASEVGIQLPLKRFDQLSRIIPHLCDMSPAGPFYVKDLHEAGGIPTVMKELSRFLNLNCLTVTGKTIRENIIKADNKRFEVIRTVKSPVHLEGGIAILKGSLAPEGAVVKQSAVNQAMLKFEGDAVTFDSEEDAIEAIFKGKVVNGDIVVIRYEGPKGGPGMREMLGATSAIKGLKLNKVALITDGRFSGATSGPCIGHVCPEAADKGPIAAVKDGDKINIDIPTRKLDLRITKQEMTRRLQDLKLPKPKVEKGYLYRYSRMVKPASKGAILKI